MLIKSIDINNFNDEKVQTQVVLESTFTKEIIISISQGQLMKEHKSPYPIIIHLLEGVIELGVESVKYQMKKNDIVTLEGNVPHDLFANEKALIRLTLSKQDIIERVKFLIEPL